MGKEQARLQTGDQRKYPPSGLAQSGLQVLEEKAKHQIIKPGTTWRNKTHYGNNEWEEYSESTAGLHAT